MDLTGTFADAMKLVAEQRLFARMCKEAAPAELIQNIHDARRELGILGADEKTVNSAVSGKFSPGAAISKIKGSVPGIGEQLRNIPRAALTAVGQGRPEDAVKQVDVPGFKNLFNPGTAVMSGGLAAGTAWASEKARENINLSNILHGKTDEGAKGLRDLLGMPSQGKGKKPSPASPKGADGSVWTDWYKDRLKGSTPPLTERLKSLWQQARHGPADRTHVGSQPLPPGAYGPAKPVEVTRKQLKQVAGNMKPTVTGRLARYGLPALAASLPLLYREWISSKGYRSGHEPAKKLVEANQELKRK